MPGVVYALGVQLARFSPAIALGAGANIPPGEYIVSGAWSQLINGTATTMPAGYCLSDGTNSTITAAGNAVPIGGGLNPPPPSWPWPLPWPLSQMPWPAT